MLQRKNFKGYLLNWIGGKRLLRKTIDPFIPEDIKVYIEPFGGAGWVLFYKDKWAELEIYNDLDDRLVNLFRIVKYHPEELIKQFRYMVTSRTIFKETLEGSAYTDIQKAAKFLYLISRSFGGKGTHFGTAKKSTGSIKSQLNIIDRINQIFTRLDKVLIENLDFEILIKNYDSEEAFFYCDPPYVTGAEYYKTSANGFDHVRLRDLLKDIKGRFLLSYDDNPLIHELYKDFIIIEVQRQKGINNKNPNGNIFKELLVKNY